MTNDKTTAAADLTDVRARVQKLEDRAETQSELSMLRHRDYESRIAALETQVTFLNGVVQGISARQDAHEKEHP